MKSMVPHGNIVNLLGYCTTPGMPSLPDTACDDACNRDRYSHIFIIIYILTCSFSVTRHV